MNRTDRILLEQHVTQLDQLQRSILDMRSVLVRRIRRLEREPAAPVRAAREPAPVIAVREPVTVEPVAVVMEKIKTRSKTVKVSETDSVLPDVCGICLNHHKKIDTLMCQCNHLFGKECFNGWKRICRKSKKNASCPTCRETVTLVTNFRARKARALKPVTSLVTSPVTEPIIIILD